MSRDLKRAIYTTSGDLIALSNQDGLWYPDRLSRAVRQLESGPELDLGSTNARRVDWLGASLGCTLFEVLQIRWTHRGAIQLKRCAGIFHQAKPRNKNHHDTLTPFDRKVSAICPHWMHNEWLVIMAASTGQLDVID